jgi:hypothetical protein
VKPEIQQHLTNVDFAEQELIIAMRAVRRLICQAQEDHLPTPELTDELRAVYAKAAMERLDVVWGAASTLASEALQLHSAVAALRGETATQENDQ